MIQDIDVKDWRKLREEKQIATVDVRSPSEFEAATIPGALNIPLFDDRERAEVGTLYTQTSVQAAKEKGLEIVSAKLPAFIREFAQIPGRKAVFCWRGGMRSKTAATLLSLMDIHVYRLTGGYRAYRQWVVDTLGTMSFVPPAYVVHGPTGSGKTAVLRLLQSKGAPVLDLEHFAGHRGSIFGHIGLQSHNQKMFDALLLDELLRHERAPYVLMEAESKRIGKAVMPDFLADKKEQGEQIWLDVPLETRARRILDDYRPWERPQQFLDAFRRIKLRIHTPVAAEIELCLLQEKYARAVELLLLFYYDPLYEHTSEKYDSARRTVVRADSAEEAAAEIERLLPSAEQRKVPKMDGDRL
ncbi:tRNA 2-selenouridine(34) synthase MnmH [Cohnella zeiphila]|uniref:tRNA 2-selenouridine(34) synthase MnmH n=1 Tax=Cohnella zeiphila TaxID=2761120 RepID=A0A7X0VZ66_9BACL|nr:tRNA 2-selenouridine(34) synthase MnmH [Cohnella zeiphila]MBB6733673.1 tRNA 2-selenouridine(34) synthase MnmH [Cohnella zeiphila]